MPTGFQNRAIRKPVSLYRLLAAAFAAVLLALAGTGCQSNPQAAARAYVASGKKYIAQKKFSDAAIEFRNALQRDPKDWRARYLLARVENQMHLWRACYQDLKEVVNEQPSFAPARLDLAELYIAADQDDLAQHQIDRVRQLSAKNVRAELVQMKLYLTRGLLDRAGKQCDAIQKLAPDNDQVYALCGLAAVGQKRYAAAEQNFQHALGLDPGDTENYRNLSNVLDLEGKTAQAENLLASGIGKQPKSLDLELLLADLYVRHGRIDDVDRLFAGLRARQNQFPGLLVTLGNFWMWRNELGRAVAEYQAAEAAHPSELIEKNLASAYLTLHQVSEAQRFTGAVLRRDPQSADARALEGAIDYLKGDYSHASQLLQSARKDDPGSILPDFYLGMTWLATGQLDRAKQAFGDCIQKNGKFVEAYARLGQIALDSNDWRLGAAYAQKVLAINPGSVNGYLLLAQADMMEGDLKAAGQVIAAAEKVPQSPQAVEQVAIRYDIFRKDFAHADRQFAHLVSVSTKPFPLVAWYAEQLVSAGEVSRAIPQVRAWIAHSPQNPAANELLARLYFLEGDLGPAESSVRLSLAEQGGRATALDLLGEILERRGKTAEAAQEYAIAIQTDPADIQGDLLAGDLRMRQGQYAQAQPYFEAARTQAPESDAAKLALVRCWAAQDIHLDRALGRAQDLKTKYPQNPSVAGALGWIYHERGVNALALPQLTMAAQARPLDAVLQFHLGMTLLSENDKAHARRLLALALKLGLAPSERAAARRALLATGTGKTR
ncbi:MAG TPA: tetratricopeptide repeat protein [Patescibacteria group bacterium]|nr:tetratricopeptide repeat protein [Patescibacteria group bacterium]